MLSSGDYTINELMHHYLTNAYLDLGSPKNFHIWQVEIPRMATAHDFLMKGLIGISALHLSTLQPTRRVELLHYGTALSDIAFPSFRYFISARDKPETIHAAFAFAGFVIPYILTLSSWLDTPKDRIPTAHDDRPHWFIVIRGLVDLTARNWLELNKGPLAPLLVRSTSPIDLERNPDDEHLSKIHMLLDQRRASYPDIKDDIEVCRKALDELRRVAALPWSKFRTLENCGVVYVWPGSISQEFIELIYERNPEALVILAHYCVMLKKIDYNWYFSGVGAGMLAAIGGELDEDYAPWIEWAIAQPCHTKRLIF